MAERKELRVVCPDCDTTFTVDARTGKVVTHLNREEARSGGKDLFSQALGKVSERTQQEDKLLDQARKSIEDKAAQAEDAFEKAARHAREEFRKQKKDPEPPPW